MSASRKEHPFIGELRDFLAFLKSLWGLLTGISSVFPLANAFANLIPMRTVSDDPIGPLNIVTPAMITTVSMLVTLFLLLMTFSGRNRLRTAASRGRIQRRAGISFTAGVLCLLVYLVAHAAIMPLFHLPMEIYRGDPRALIGDFTLLISYTGFFALVTRGFVLLGLMEFYGVKE